MRIIISLLFIVAITQVNAQTYVLHQLERCELAGSKYGALLETMDMSCEEDIKTEKLVANGVIKNNKPEFVLMTTTGEHLWYYSMDRSNKSTETFHTVIGQGLKMKQIKFEPFIEGKIIKLQIFRGTIQMKE